MPLQNLNSLECNFMFSALEQIRALEQRQRHLKEILNLTPVKPYVPHSVVRALGQTQPPNPNLKIIDTATTRAKEVLRQQYALYVDYIIDTFGLNTEERKQAYEQYGTVNIYNELMALYDGSSWDSIFDSYLNAYPIMKQIIADEWDRYHMGQYEYSIKNGDFELTAEDIALLKNADNSILKEKTQNND